MAVTFEPRGRPCTVGTAAASSSTPSAAPKAVDGRVGDGVARWDSSVEYRSVSVIAVFFSLTPSPQWGTAPEVPLPTRGRRFHWQSLFLVNEATLSRSSFGARASLAHAPLAHERLTPDPPAFCGSRAAAARTEHSVDYFRQLLHRTMSVERGAARGVLLPVAGLVGVVGRLLVEKDKLLHGLHVGLPHTRPESRVPVNLRAW